MIDKNQSFPAGDQLDEQQLHRRQQQQNKDRRIRPAPTVVAVGVRTPENLGAVMRGADAAGSERIIFVDTECLPQNKKIARVARNTDRHLQIDYLSMDDFLIRIPELPPLVAVEITSRSRNLFSSGLPLCCCLVIGAERHGIPAGLLARCSVAVHIPMYGVNSSMNLSHALILALYEWRRRHGA